MWNKIKLAFFVQIIIPIRMFLEWIFGKKKKEIPRTWPYADKKIGEGPDQKLSYHWNAKQLESKLSRTFRKKK